MDRMLTATQFIRDAQQKSPSTPTSGGSSPIHLHGLSLLSALSSHEYASMEHVYDGQDAKHYDDADNQEMHEEEVVTEVSIISNIMDRNTCSRVLPFESKLNNYITCQCLKEMASRI